MVLTPSTMLELGTPAPDFSLFEPKSSTERSLKDFQGNKGMMLVFMCNHCPYVVYLMDHLFRTASEYQEKGISFVAINSNDVDGYPQDGPEKMAELAQKMSFPFLFDESQEVAKAYKAACTPDFYLFNEQNLCVYRGRYDASRPNTGVLPTGEDLIGAMDALLGGTNVPADQQYPSVGCNIKWKNT